MIEGPQLRIPVHQDLRSSRRASADRATDSLRRRRAARHFHDSNSRRVAAIAEKFRAPVAAAERSSGPQEWQPAALPRRAMAAPAQHYLVLYFALAVTSVLAAAMAHTQKHNGGRRAHHSLIAIAPQAVSKALAVPMAMPLRDAAISEVAEHSGAPPLAGLAALRETIQSRQVDTWLQSGMTQGSQTVRQAANSAVLRPEDPEAVGHVMQSPAFDDEFGPGIKAPGICDLADVSEAEATGNAEALAAGSPGSVPGGGTSQAPEREFGVALAAAAQRQTSEFTVYTDKYRQMSYPMGDVPALFGVCTDVVIRAYRSLGVDLQALIHIARIGPADTSIAHRRTFTLRRYFASRGASVPISEFAEDYMPGDIVTYHRPQNRGSRDHIAIVSNLIAPSGRPMIVHNRGWGPQVEDALFVDKITGHYRFRGPEDNALAGAEAKQAPSAASAKPGMKARKPRAAALKAETQSRSGRPEAPNVRR